MGKKNKEVVVDEKILEELRSLIVDRTEEAFHIKVASDDCSSHLACYADRNEEDKSSWSESLPNTLHGWRVLTISVPHGFVETFFK